MTPKNNSQFHRRRATKVEIRATEKTTRPEDRNRRFGQATNSITFSYQSLVQIERFWVPDSPGAFRAVFGPPPDRVLQTTRCGRPRDEFEHESRHHDDDDDDDGDDDHDDGKDDDDGDDDDTDEPIS